MGDHEAYEILSTTKINAQIESITGYGAYTKYLMSILNILLTPIYYIFFFIIYRKQGSYRHAKRTTFIIFC